MTPVTFATDNPTEAILWEQAQAMIRDLVATGDHAEDGQVLNKLESFLLTRGRDFLRHALETTAQAQAEVAEKKGSRPGPVRAATGGTIKGGRRGNC
jgi:malic enzyme